MAYATLIHVLAQDVGRPGGNATIYSATTKPSDSQVGLYLTHTGAEIDAILRARGYTLPVATTATSALAYLEGMNAIGAAAMVSQGAQVDGGKRTTAMAIWESMKKALAAGLVQLDAPISGVSAKVRHSTIATPMFRTDECW